MGCDTRMDVIQNGATLPYFDNQMRLGIQFTQRNILNAYRSSVEGPEEMRPSGGLKCWWDDNIKTEIKHRSEGCGIDSSGLRNDPLSGSCDRGNHASFPLGWGIWLRDKQNRLWRRILFYGIMLVQYCSKLSKRHFMVHRRRKAERMGRRGRRRKQLMYGLKEDRRWWNLKEEALDRTWRRSRFGRVYRFVVEDTTWFRRYHES